MGTERALPPPKPKLRFVGGDPDEDDPVETNCFTGCVSTDTRFSLSLAAAASIFAASSRSARCRRSTSRCCSSSVAPGVCTFAPQVGHGEPSSLLHPPCVGRVPTRGHAQVEASVTGHQQPFRPVHLEVLLAGNEHGNPCPVLRFEEHLLQLILGGVER